jgi:hypothetical protein
MATVLVSFALVGAATAPFATASHTGLAFQDVRPLRIAWDEAQRGVAVGICNGWRAAARHVSAHATDFRFKKKDQDVPDDAVISVGFKNEPTSGAASKPSLRGGTAAKPDTLQSGRCGTASVKMTGTADAKTYTGVLTVTSAGGAGLARRSVIIAAPKVKKSKKVKPEGAVDTETFDAHRDHPFPVGATLVDGRLALKAPPKHTGLEVPSRCPDRRRLQHLEQREQDLRTESLLGMTVTRAALEAAAKERKAEQATRRSLCPLVGHLFNRTQVAAVFVDGPPKNSGDGLTFLPIRLDKASKIGDYEGSLDLASTPSNPKDDVKVKVTVTEKWGWAVGALLLGAVLSLVSQYVLRRVWPRRQLRGRCRAFDEDYAGAKTRFDQHVAGGGASEGPGQDAAGATTDASAADLTAFQTPASREIAHYVNDVKDGIKRYSRSVVWFDDQSGAYKQIDASIDQVEADIACWNDGTQLAQSLTGLNGALTELLNLVNQEWPMPRKPRLAERAAAVLKGRQLKVGEATEVAAQAAAETKLVNDWTTRARALKRLYIWWGQLSKRIDKPEDVELLHRAASALNEATQELLDVGQAADFKELRTTRSMHAAYDLLAVLGATYGWLPATDEKLESVGQRDTEYLRHHHPIAATLFTTDRRWPRGPSVAALVQQAASRSGVPARPALLARALPPIAAALVIVFSVAVGVAGGLAAFYFGKTWGTLEDYITVIVLGASAQLLVQGVADTVAKLLPPVPDHLISGPAAAKAAPAGSAS